MRINFRQGIVSNAVTSTFQTGTVNLSGSYINLNIPNPNFPIVLTFADGNFNYLYAFRLSRLDAWGPFLPGIDAYLFVDINKPTGAVSFGSSPYDPVVAVTAPLSPVNGQHWFDMLNRQMKVWDSTTSLWLPRVRVFVGKLAFGTLPLISMSINAGLPNTNTNYYLGTQVGDPTPNEAGYILFSGGQALVRSDGSFLTTVDVLVAEGVQESAPVTFATNTLAAVASTSLGAFSMVSFNAPGEIGLMSDLDMNTKVYGIIVEGAGVGDTVTVITAGIVNVPTTSIVGGPGLVNAPLYVNATGGLTLTRPASAPDPVAAVVNPTPSTVMIYLLAADILVPSDIYSATFVDVTGDTMTGSLIMSGVGTQVLLPNLPTAGAHAANRTYVDAGDSINATNLTIHIADTAVHKTPTQDSFLVDVDAAAVGVLVKDAAGSAITRTITGTPGNILVADGSGVVGNPTLNLAAIVQGASGTFQKFTLDGFGRVVAVNPVLGSDIDTALGYVAVPNTRTVSTTTPLSGGGALSANLTLSLDDTAVTPAAYGAADTVGTFTVDQKGRLTAAADVLIDITASQVNDFAAAVTAEVAEPANQIVFGTTTDIDSASTLTYNSTSGGFDINTTFAAVAAPGDITLIAAGGTLANDGGDVYIQGGNSATGAGGDITLAVGTGGTVGIIQLASSWTLQVSTDLQIGGDAGTAGELMSSNGTGSAPSWKTLAEVPTQVTTQAVPYVVVSGVEVVLATGTGNVTLPSPTSGRRVNVKNVAAGSVTVVPFGAELIDGAASWPLAAQWDAVTLVSDGTDWFVL